ncbi:hypothetical protein [Nocardioides sp. zg-1230]|uniref:hypothetical protein n=1 Tax=Nocardioides sp. zg-1230 TaxID=2736601 RepID=UPI001552B6D2|nr:hypothetical protein [Nocardioides sp. zg-1230]NPC41923.1 hypothetical protein [Nocardioides sp. zg-1230]
MTSIDTGGLSAEVQAILAAGDERDAAADARDAAADERDRAIDLAEMLDAESSYGAQWSQRRAAALDRRQAHEDRAASRKDRWALARRLNSLPPGRG